MNFECVPRAIGATSRAKAFTTPRLVVLRTQSGRVRRGWQRRLARRDARRGTRRTGPSRTWCEAKREAATRCLTDIDWIPAWAPCASCGDHERRAPARRRRRRGPDRECAVADLARGVSAAASPSIRLSRVELVREHPSLPRRVTHGPIANTSTCLSSPL